MLVLTLIGANVVLHPPQLRYFSSLLPLRGAFDADVLSGVVTTLGAAIVALYVWATGDGLRERFRFRAGLVLLSCALFVVVPTFADITARAVSGLKEHGRFIAFPHDGGVLQTEAAAELLLSGQNPYTADYEQTEMAESHHSAPALWKGMGLSRNPAMSFYPYPPLTFLSAAALGTPAKALFGFYDQRFLYLLALCSLVWLTPRIVKGRSQQLALMAFLTLCPWETRYLVQGYNDLLCTTLLVATIAALRSERMVIAAICLALACGAKQFAWFAVPLFFTWMKARARPEHLKGSFWFPALGFAAVSALLFLPFLAWNPRALLHSLIVAQGYEYPFRIQGFGASNVLVLLGLVHKPMQTFAAQSLLSALVVPVLLMGMWRVYRTRELRVVLLALSAAIFVFVFVSRHFATNYLYLPTALVVCAWMIELDEDVARAGELHAALANEA